jgi:hypothetical protein
VGYPNIAQGDVDDSTLEITQMGVNNPTPDSFSANITQVLGTDSTFHPTFDDWAATVMIAGAETPFLNLQIPSFKANDGTEIHLEQNVDLGDNVDGFSDFATAVMVNETVSLIIKGNPQLQEGKLPMIGVTYDKTVSMKGNSHLFPTFENYKLIKLS